MESYLTYLHNPPHLFRANAIYIVTGSTLRHRHILGSDEKKAFFCRTLFERAERSQWQLEAWAILSNHYHLVARVMGEAITLQRLIRSLHSQTAIFCNRVDGTPGREVWHNYWDSCITYETSYLARLHYVHTNPARHGLVKDARDYPFCSCRWFLESADIEFRRKVFAQPRDWVRVGDGFGVQPLEKPV